MFNDQREIIPSYKLKQTMTKDLRYVVMQIKVTAALHIRQSCSGSADGRRVE